jgi:hypothetical protein
MIETWAPQRACTNDPMAGITCAWESIVGEDLAQKTRPSRFDGVTLHIITISGAWSQQLAFLEPQILSALQCLPEVKSIERLRFRVGRLRAGSSALQTLHCAPAPPARVRADDIPTGASALERLRIRCARSRRDARALCVDCGVPMPEESTRCAPCAYAGRRERNERVQRIMYETPWSTHEDISTQIGGLAREEYEDIRRALLRRWREILDRADRTGKVRPDGYERRIAESYIPLQSGLPPDRISPAAARNLLGNRLEALLIDPGGLCAGRNE